MSKVDLSSRDSFKNNWLIARAPNTELVGASKVKVAILGGGVAGLSAAHELAKFANFEVHVFEREKSVGGKARSQDVGRKLGANHALFLGEHGFRLFPHFYRHITETLKEIPFTGAMAERLGRLPAMDGNVWGNLRGSTEGGYADGALRKTQRPFPPTTLDLTRAVRELLGGDAPATQTDVICYAWHLLKFLTACQERRDEEYDRLTWAEFIGVGKGLYTSAFEAFIRAAPRNLSAMWPDRCSARSCGGTLAQMMIDFTGERGLTMDAVLTGPTTETWLEAWKELLSPPTGEVSKRNTFGKVYFNEGWTLVGFEFDGLQITSAVVEPSDPRQQLERLRARNISRDGATEAEDPREAGDDARYSFKSDYHYFICAIPLEAMQKVLETREASMAPVPQDARDSCARSAQAMMEFDESLKLIRQIEGGTAPMVGLQFFLRKDVGICHGHMLYPKSPWALTSVSQAQFWEKQLVAGSLAGHLAPDHIGVKGVLSVIISDWDTPAPRLGRAARDCTPREIKREVWLQLTDALREGDVVLKDEFLLGWKGHSDNFYRNDQPTRVSKTSSRDDTGEQAALPGEEEVLDAVAEHLGRTPEEEDDRLELKHPFEDWEHAPLRWKKLDEVLRTAAHLDDNLLWEERVILLRNPETDEEKERLRYVPQKEVVSTPLFVHPRGSQRLRPDAQLRIPNLLLASDYVRTYTDLATMEAANEAARRAVLAILQRETIASPELFPKLWPLGEGTVFEAAKAFDRLLYLNGQPHVMDAPQVLSALFGTAFDGLFQSGIDLLGMRGRMGPPPDLARRIASAVRTSGGAPNRNTITSGYEGMLKFLSAASFLGGLR